MPQRPNRDDESSVGSNEQNRPATTRRDALVKVGKFAAFVAPAAYVLLDATQAQAQPCSQHPSPLPGQNCT